jgi:predicted Mrr-cat superfamily restriction endonuclease
MGQAWRFVHGIAQGDLVALPLKAESAIALGKVTGD